MQTIQSNSYPVIFDNSIDELIAFIKKGAYTRFFVLTDENTSKYCLPLISEKLDELGNYDLIEITAGEESKNIDFCIGVWKMLIDFGADRKSLMVNLGGGVITDMGGFAASTYKRGIDFVHIPTTLLSQVDASVGGKTGIDVDGIKNIIGTFTEPKAVFIDTAFLQTLPAREILSGTAEMLKHGLILDADYWDQLINADLSAPTAAMVHASVALKNKVVMQDPKEQNIRKSLNFGHTVGHAVETWALNDKAGSLTHGEAIAIGMICESYLSVQKAGLSPAEFEEIVKVFTRLYPYFSFSADIYDELYAFMLNDKKNTGGNVNCTLLTAIGSFSIDHVCSREELFGALDYYRSLAKA